MKTKDRALKVGALMLVMGLFVGKTANAASFKEFPYVFNYNVKAPTNTNHTSQTVDVLGNANENAQGKCTKYSYSGNEPSLLMESVTALYPVNSKQFMSVTTKNLPYKGAIPGRGCKVKFKGTVKNYSNQVNIVASVKG